MTNKKFPPAKQGFTFKKLQSVEGLKALDDQFFKTLPDVLQTQLLDYRDLNVEWSRIQTSEFLTTLAPKLAAFIATLFDVSETLNKHKNTVCSHDPIFEFKHQFLNKLLKKKTTQVFSDQRFETLHKTLLSQLPVSKNIEHAVAIFALDAIDQNKTDSLSLITDWCLAAANTQAGQLATQEWMLFKHPSARDPNHLIPMEVVSDHLEIKQEKRRSRDGFDLTHEKPSVEEVLYEIDNCKFCHTHEGDYCATGFYEKKSDPRAGYKTGPLGNTLTGCPLEEKISEMQALYAQGELLAALAVIMVDNPMCAATGDRICNDCMKACIYQKQDPVDIPKIETHILDSVLQLPWGVEIYQLLLNWDPLRRAQWLPKKYTGHKVLVAGMGPAGFTMAHHLLMEGCAVVGIDGAKIEPLPASLLDAPVEDFATLGTSLETRQIDGFGGVAEYGITSRWNKVYLKLIYMHLMRQSTFKLFGSTRFGGEITIPRAWETGFHHVCVAVGAGLPQALPIPGSLAPGMMHASDFLMSLQLGGAYKDKSLTNLEIELPVMVIGGGLTGVDAATEARAYAVRFAERVHQCKLSIKSLDSSDQAIYNRLTKLGEQLVSERKIAAKENRPANLDTIIESLGGVSIVYRKCLQDSPAYRKNHEELSKALEEGLRYYESHTPIKVVLDDDGRVKGLVCDVPEGEVTLPARTILVATGASPNVAYEFEHQGSLARQRFQYLPHQLNTGHLKPVTLNGHVKSNYQAVYGSYEDEAGHHVSFIGDTHPHYHGNVVSAIASAQHHYGTIVQDMQQHFDIKPDDHHAFFKAIEHNFHATLIDKQQLDDTFCLFTIKAPQVVAAYEPGQFLKLQNFADHEQKLCEPVPVYAINLDRQAGTCQVLLWCEGENRKQLAAIAVGEPLALMGPSGVRTKIPGAPNKILIAGSYLVIPYLLSVGPALKAAGHEVVAVIQSATLPEIVLDYINNASDQMHIADEPNHLFDYIKQLEDADIQAFDRVTLCDTPEVLTRFKQECQSLFRTDKIFASLPGVIQCALKGVCARCLQWQIDQITGERTKAVFACSWQDQPLALIDIENIKERQKQHGVVKALF